MSRLSVRAATLLAAAAVMVGGSTAAVADDGDGTVPYEGPTTVTESMTQSEALEVQVPNAPTALTPSKPGMISPDCVCPSDPTTYVRVVSGPTYMTKRFVRYLTGAWTYANHYTWSTTTTTTATLSADIGMSASSVSSKLGVSSARSVSYSIAVNIRSDPYRLSKLGLYSDYNRRYVKTYKLNLAGAEHSVKYAYHYAPTSVHYLITTYK